MERKIFRSTISILLLVALLVALLFYPDSSRALSMGILIFGVGTAIIFTIQKNLHEHKEDNLTNKNFLRNTALDLIGLALTMGAAIWLGRLVGGYTGMAVGSRAGQNWGMLAGIVAGMGAGFVGAWSLCLRDGFAQLRSPKTSVWKKRTLTIRISSSMLPTAKDH